LLFEEYGASALKYLSKRLRWEFPGTGGAFSPRVVPYGI